MATTYDENTQAFLDKMDQNLRIDNEIQTLIIMEIADDPTIDFGAVNLNGSPKNYTPLMKAISIGAFKVAIVLLNTGKSNPWYENPEGKSALSLAIQPAGPRQSRLFQHMQSRLHAELAKDPPAPPPPPPPFATNVVALTDCKNDADMITMDDFTADDIGENRIVKLSDGNCYNVDAVKKWLNSGTNSDQTLPSRARPTDADLTLLDIARRRKHAREEGGNRRRRGRSRCKNRRGKCRRTRRRK